MPENGIATDLWRIYTLLQTCLSVGVLGFWWSLIDRLTQQQRQMVTCSEVDTVKEENVKSWHALTALIPIPVQGLYIKCGLLKTCPFCGSRATGSSSSLLLLEFLISPGAALLPSCQSSLQPFSGNTTAVAVEWAVEAWVSTTGCFSSLTSYPRIRWLLSPGG